MRARPRQTFTVLTLVGALASGCGGEAGESKGSASTGEAEHGRFDPDARGSNEMPDQPTAVTLIDAGAEPREALRHPAYGASRRLEIATETFHDGEAKPFMTMTMTWAGASTGGDDFGYRWAVVKARAEFGREYSEDSKADEFGRGLTKVFESLRGQATGTPTGLTRVIQIEGMNATPSPVAQLYFFAVPLPDEAVGVGAIWERTSDPNLAEDPEGPALRKLVSPRVADADEIVKTERYTLAERQGDVLTIDYELTLKARGAEAPIQTAKGRHVVVLGDPLAQAGSFDLVSVQVFPAREGREETRFEHTQRLSLTTVE